MTETAINQEQFSDWIGKSESADDHIAAGQAALFHATFDCEFPLPGAGDALPPLWHWAYFLTAARHSDLGRDGHPKKGDFFPPLPLPRRMWAGGRVEVNTPLRIGDQATKRATITSIQPKSGRTGELCFVTVRYDFLVDGECRLSEEHDIVYREDDAPDAKPAEPPAAPTGADWSENIEPDPVQLFRYSALTFNSHRIHYDRAYCTEVEGYPGLVVHGPFTSTLLIGMVGKYLPDAEVAKFAFRAMGPLIDISPFTINGREMDGRVELWAADGEGRLAMQAHADLR